MRLDDDTLVRFQAKWRLNPATQCWEWTAGINCYGYGHFMMRHPKRMERAHRVAYFIFKGKIPKGKLVLHSCDVRHCVNPSHLFTGTHKNNVDDCVAKKRNIFGNRHPNAKLNVAAVKAIRNDTRVESLIALDYGVSEATINDVRNFRCWRHV